MDNLREEFESIKKLSPSLRKERLAVFHDKIARLKFLDPACGCGNFLVISYRELRLLEIEVLELLLGEDKVLDVDNEIKVNVNQFYGIEIEEFPAQIAQVAMWLTDHQMNMKVSETFGKYFVRIPLTVAASIHCANSLAIDWESVVPKSELSYILGNPPFLGARVMNKTQKNEVITIFENMKDCGNLDYVTCWYKKAARYIRETDIECAFVSTNSICQGLQVSILWTELINKHNVKINFAHQTFKWGNEAKGKAAVSCIIVGFSLQDRPIKKLYHYSSARGKPVETLTNKINAYLVDADNVFLESRSTPLCVAPEMIFGSMPNDGGYLLLTEEERRYVQEKEPDMLQYIRRFVGSKEFINNITRYCLWFKDVAPKELRQNSLVKQKLQQVKKHREQSKREATRKLAEIPALFGEIRQPETDYLLIPSTSSEKRKIIPMGFIGKDTISSDANLLIPNATLYEFGILTSIMHMAWTRHVCGYLETSYRYSASIVYNNFPWPKPTDKQRSAIEKAAQSVLEARAKYPESSLADLYDPLTMPPDLLKAHQKLDRAVEAAYGREFDNDSQRVAYLFELYQKIAGELFIDKKKRGKGRKI